MEKKDKIEEKFVREPSVEVQIKRSMIPLYINLFLVFLFLVFLFFLFAMVMVFLSSYFESLALPINMIVITLFIGFYLIYLVFTYLNYKAVSYTLIPGSIQKTSMNTIDQIPGKILVKVGFLYRNKILLSMNDYDHLKIEKSFVGRLNNFGNIFVMEKDELDTSQNYVLTNVIKPEEIAKIIQKMIDVEIPMPSPSRPNNTSNLNRKSK
ncbi:hypothetical protein KC675_03730 [Candidatus Dojkabacteria bacterium]|uniref:Uncharacterized protein n=1 Tax=Candidatus Dojkabacteria bacterium TaxID=2099670 RepID=A0A955I9B8_9BACT|nr:hypothetical protein [Candidatus Dojkabacteria bacterium]